MQGKYVFGIPSIFCSLVALLKPFTPLAYIPFIEVRENEWDFSLRVSTKHFSLFL
jgi:hypothetical protein